MKYSTLTLNAKLMLECLELRECPAVHTFIGSGSSSVKVNWQDSSIPPAYPQTRSSAAVRPGT